MTAGDGASHIIPCVVIAISDRSAVEGIECVTPLDIEYARRFGLRIKLLAIAKRGPDGIEARVHPTMIPATSVLAGVSGLMNAIEVYGAMSGPTLYYGAGAGSLPTASAVVSDLMELARSSRQNGSGRVPPLGRPELRTERLLPPEDQPPFPLLCCQGMDRLYDEPAHTFGTGWGS